jgi:hypothetical protein
MQPSFEMDKKPVSKLPSYVLTILILLLCFVDLSCAEPARWSRDAVSFLFAPRGEDVRVLAPDGKRIALFHDFRIDVIEGSERLIEEGRLGIPYFSELLWSPDSNGFVVTESDGGDVGSWRTWVYLIEGRRVRWFDPSKFVVNEFKKHYECMEPEEPNIGAITWIGSSKNLLLVAEVPPHSTCPEMAMVMGYIIEIPSGTIKREISEEKLFADWSQYLGRRFSYKLDQYRRQKEAPTSK